MKGFNKHFPKKQNLMLINLLILLVFCLSSFYSDITNIFAIWNFITYDKHRFLSLKRIQSKAPNQWSDHACELLLIFHDTTGDFDRPTKINTLYTTTPGRRLASSYWKLTPYTSTIGSAAARRWLPIEHEFTVHGHIWYCNLVYQTSFLSLGHNHTFWPVSNQHSQTQNHMRHHLCIGILFTNPTLTNQPTTCYSESFSIL